MKMINQDKFRLVLAFSILLLASLACTHIFFIDNEADCIDAGGDWKGSTCYTAAEIDRDKGNQRIPTGTFTGESTFYTTLENDVDNSYLAPVCTKNTIRVVLNSDGTANGEVRSICSASRDTDNEEMRTTHHSEVVGSIQGEWVDDAWQLSIDYTWRSYFTSPQWDTTSMDNTVEFVFPYHVSIANDVMTLTPAAEVEGYYSFTLQKQ